MGKKLGVGIIGSGNISKAHASAYQSFSGASLLAFCDIDEEKAKNQAKEFGCELWYTDYQKMLKNPEIDVVSVYVRFAQQFTS